MLQMRFNATNATSGVKLSDPLSGGRVRKSAAATCSLLKVDKWQQQKYFKKEEEKKQIKKKKDKNKDKKKC